MIGPEAWTFRRFFAVCPKDVAHREKTRRKELLETLPFGSFFHYFFFSQSILAHAHLHIETL